MAETIAVIHGTDEVGRRIPVPATGEGHLEVAIHGPRLPFGSVHVENLTPIFQVDAVYGINSNEIVATTGLAYDPGPAPGDNTGLNTGTGNLFKCSTGATAYSFAAIQSRKRLRYRAGQGVVGRFTAMYSTPVASSILVAGVGTGESGYYFGYNGTSFGILHSTGGVREIQTFTVSAECTGSGTGTFRVAGLDYAFTLPVSATTARAAYDISTLTIPGWSLQAVGSTVIFLSGSVGNKTGTFSFTLGTATGLAGTFTETVAGVASTDTWVPQSAWNGPDKLDGEGSSGVTLDPSKGNVFQIGVQYLGFGSVTMAIEAGVSPNNPDWVVVHTFDFPNARTTVSAIQPSFPFTMSAYSSGSTTDVWVACSSVGGFVEGQKKLTGPLMTYTREANNYVGSTASTYYPLYTVLNRATYGIGGVNRANQSVVNIISVGAAHGDNTPVTLYLIKNATLIGPVSFANWSTESCTAVDQGATTCTFTKNEQLLLSLPMGNGSNAILTLSEDLMLQPGESVTVAARAVTGTTVWVIADMNTREDQ